MRDAASGVARDGRARCGRWRGGRERGFTLIEMLVVVSIVAVLMAILLPSLRLARGQAREVYCMNNLHGIATALSAYITANEDRLPFIDSALWQPDGRLNWDADPDDGAAYPQSVRQVLRGYVDQPGVFVCPSAVRGYPRARYKVTYRMASADNFNGKVESVFYDDGRPKYAYSLKYLDGRKYVVKHVDPRHIPLRLADGPGPYYLFRDFGSEDPQGRPKLPHHNAYNQLFLDLRVETIRNPSSPIVF